MATTNSSPDPASALLSLNRNQTVNATVEQTGVPVPGGQGWTQMGAQEGGVTPGSSQGSGPATLQNGTNPNLPNAVPGAVSNMQNVSPGAPSGAGQPGTTAGGVSGTGLATGNAPTQNYYIVSPGGAAPQTPAPGGGANGPTPSNAYELISRTS
jgi:hypothetical protein